MGPQGEQGPTGANGIDGANGVNGTDGTNGEDGNANVIASEWIEPKESSYSVNGASNKTLALSNNIGPDLRNKGVILVYYDDDILIRLLPQLTFQYTTGEISKSIESRINHASHALYVNIKKYGSDLTAREYLWDASGPAYGKGVRFRYVLIPSGTSGKNNRINFKEMSYEEVMDYLGLEY